MCAGPCEHRPWKHRLRWADSEAEFFHFGSHSHIGSAFIVDFFLNFHVLVTATQVSSERRPVLTA